MIESLLRWIARFMSRVRVNRVERVDDDGASMIVKRRRLGGSAVVLLGNVFLVLAQSGVRMFVRARRWGEWERHCFGLLYPEFPPALAESGSAVRLPAMPGTSLRTMLERGELGAGAMVAAARELRRAHKIHCPFFGAGWSHGDLHLDNVLYDARTDRAFLIDFDTCHVVGIDENQRRADDLMVLLLEVIAAPGDAWREPSRTFLREYGETRVLDELADRLTVPRGFAKILWYTRTGCRPDREIVPRIQSLGATVRELTAPRGIHAAVPDHRLSSGA